MPHPSPPAAAWVDRLPVTEAHAAGLNIHNHQITASVRLGRGGRGRGCHSHAPAGPRRARRVAAWARRDRGRDGIHGHLLGCAVPDSRSGRHPRGLGACPARQAGPRPQDGRGRQPVAGEHGPVRLGAAELRTASGLQRATPAVQVPAQGRRRPRPGAPEPAEDARL